MIKHYSATVYDCDGKYHHAKTETVVLFKDHKEEIAASDRLISDLRGTVKEMSQELQEYVNALIGIADYTILGATKEIIQRANEVMK